MTGVSTAERKVMEAVAKHMRHKVPTKSAVIKGQKVEYFYGMLIHLWYVSGVKWYCVVAVFCLLYGSKVEGLVKIDIAQQNQPVNYCH